MFHHPRALYTSQLISIFGSPRGFVVCHKKAKKPFKNRILFVDVEVSIKIIKILKPELIYSGSPLDEMGTEHFLLFEIQMENKRHRHIFFLYGAANSERVLMSI